MAAVSFWHVPVITLVPWDLQDHLLLYLPQRWNQPFLHRFLVFSTVEWHRDSKTGYRVCSWLLRRLCFSFFQWTELGNTCIALFSVLTALKKLCIDLLVSFFLLFHPFSSEFYDGICHYTVKSFLRYMFLKFIWKVKVVYSKTNFFNPPVDFSPLSTLSKSSTVTFPLVLKSTVVSIIWATARIFIQWNAELLIPRESERPFPPKVQQIHVCHITHLRAYAHLVAYGWNILHYLYCPHSHTLFLFWAPVHEFKEVKKQSKSHFSMYPRSQA